MSQLTKEEGNKFPIIGLIAELSVAQKFLYLGYQVAKPLIDVGYDYVVLIDGNWQRVQVKQASLYSPSKGYEYCRLDLTANKHHYSDYCQRFDFLAIVFGSRLWLLPSSVITGRYISLTKKYDTFLI